jgi:5-methylcytosine-specific restriction endonuclease McrA
MSNDTLLLNADGSPLSITPLSSLTWQEAMKLYVLDRVNVLEWYDDWEVHSANQTFRVPCVVSVKEYIPLTKSGINFTRQNVYIRDGFCCQYCGDLFKNHELTLDHVLPKSKGGRTNWENIVTACKPCNHSKGNNEKIVPKKKPVRPNFYQVLNSKNFYITIGNEKWLNYIQWPEEYIRLIA